MSNIEELDLRSEPGFVIVSRAAGPPVKYPLADILRAIDIPVGLTHSQVAGISLLANLVVVLIRTLIDREILNEDFADELGLSWDLDHLIYVVEQLGGSYHEPNFDDVEDA